MTDAVLPSVRPVFRAIAATVVPEAASLTEREWSEVEAIVEDALAQRPPKVRRQLALLMKVIDILPRLTQGTSFRALDPSRRLRVLDRLQHAPVLLLRRGVWGIRTLAFMGYYARPAAAAGIGYRASSLGWEARR